MPLRRLVLVAAGLLAVLLAVPLLGRLAAGGAPPPPVVAPPPPPPPDPQAPESWVTPNPPPDLEQAEKVARDFALALFQADEARIRALSTPRQAARLTQPSATGRQPRGADRVFVEAVITQGLQPDVVLFHVPVTWGITGRPDRLDTMNVVVVRTAEGWRVDDSAV